MSMRTILISSGGEESVEATITEINNVDISTDDVEFALVSRDVVPVSADWAVPTATAADSNVITASVTINEGLGYDPGYYQMWLRLHDQPEVVDRIVPNLLIRLI